MLHKIKKQKWSVQPDCRGKKKQAKNDIYSLCHYQKKKIRRLNGVFHCFYTCYFLKSTCFDLNKELKKKRHFYALDNNILEYNTVIMSLEWLKGGSHARILADNPETFLHHVQHIVWISYRRPQLDPHKWGNILEELEDYMWYFSASA